MKKPVITALFIILAFGLLFPVMLNAQPYQVGELNITFTDPDRNNRQVPVRIFYPSTVSGPGVPVAEGQFPTLAFGHGFIMAYSAYQYLWEDLVPRGYIMALPTTEGSAFPAPDHLAFGLDLRFIIQKLKSESLNPGSAFYGHIAAESAVMGHSMGGGSSFLACANQGDITAMVTFAAAETSPSAVQAATGVTIPALVFAGSYDCVTPPSTNQVPMFNNLSSSCKTYISITGGGHCYFADNNFNCSLGELFCSPAAAITRETQHAIILQHLVPWLGYTLKNDRQAWLDFISLLNNPSGITSQQFCNNRIIHIKAYLEGPFNGSDMNTIIQGSPGFPMIQPFSGFPWNYDGNESVTVIPPDAVDWILLELRDAADAGQAGSGSVIARKAGFLMKEGTLMETGGLPVFLFDNTDIQQSLFAVLWQRNHLGVMSSAPLTASGSGYYYDFSYGVSQAFGGSNAHKELAPAIWGMISADGNADNQVNNLDKNVVWNSQAGTTGYKGGDFNLDGQVNNLDKNIFWKPNTGSGGQVPQ